VGLINRFDILLNQLPGMVGEATTLYFGYGSNLDRHDWLAWCEERGVDPHGIEEIGPCWLPDYRLKFHYRSVRRKGGAADVVPAGCGHAVPGVLFSLNQTALANMDRKEGHPSYYERCWVDVIMPDGGSIRALTYRVVRERRRDYVAPTHRYVELIKRGLERRNLPIGDLKSAIDNSDVSYPVQHIFVYGTLMEGEIRSDTLAQFTTNPPRKAIVSGALYDLGNYPGMRVSNEHHVVGEVHRLDDVFLSLQSLDRVEGFYGFQSKKSLFNRTLMRIEVDGELLWAWTYVYASKPPQGSFIESGSWRK
jgi:gamma-glutamylcyclotransferase (GGCT)/AIG2-like uncharacterized protein YtfP